jgi:uncharacterized protein (TIGR03083 family)
MTDAAHTLAVLRASHERLAAALGALGEDGAERPSYDDGWSVAQVASHLGSGTEIFRHYLDAGARGEPTPGNDLNQPIWDAWNAKAPTDQIRDSLAVNASFLDAVDGLSESERDGWRLEVFGSQQDLADFLQMRLNEHAVHTWDVAVALDAAATLPDDAAALVADQLARVAQWTGKPVDEPASIEVRTTAPERAYRLDLGPSGVSLTPSLDDTSAATLTLPTEAFVRLVYGRLDPDHTPPSVATEGIDLDLLRNVFPGV